MLRPLFDGFPGLHGAIDAVLEGVNGDAFVDDVDAPRVAKLVLSDFHMVAGDPAAPTARTVLAAVPAGDWVACPEPWEELLWESERPMMVTERFAFTAPEGWDMERVRATKSGLPPGFSLVRVTADTVAEFGELNESFVENFGTLERFLEQGVGFAVRDLETDRLVAGCSSFAISSRSLEFEIETHRDYERRGLALVTGSALIEWCVENGLEACWDAAHEGSARLAERLGFVDGRAYYAYRAIT
jgi:RimJ/RimL family protein N-acetyltransferase